MASYIPYNREQASLLPPDLKAWLPEDDLAHFVVAAVERVPLGAFEVATRPGGKPQYHPRLMLALLTYSYANGIFSSRRIERATYRDIAVRFVAANLNPDHDTIAAFRRTNKAAFEAAFLQVLLLARETGLLRLGSVSIDGTKIDANASKIRSVRYDRACELRAKLAADIAQLTAQAEAADAEGHDPQGLPEELARREVLKAKLDGLQGMAKAFADLNDNDETQGLRHAEGLALLLDREAVHRQDKRLGARLRSARLRHQVCPEDIDYRSARGLDRRLMQELLKGDWITAHENLAITGPTGAAKSWLACALGHQACRDNHAVLYVRVPKLFDELTLGHGDGSAGRRLKALGAVQVLILDDRGLTPLDDQARHDLLEILEDRYGRRSTLITSQLPVPDWHSVIGQATYADAILDRLVHNAHRIELTGDSLRKTRPAAATPA